MTKRAPINDPHPTSMEIIRKNYGNKKISVLFHILCVIISTRDDNLFSLLIIIDVIHSDAGGLGTYLYTKSQTTKKVSISKLFLFHTGKPEAIGDAGHVD